MWQTENDFCKAQHHIVITVFPKAHTAVQRDNKTGQQTTCSDRWTANKLHLWFTLFWAGLGISSSTRSPVFCINNSHQRQWRILSVCFTLQCSQRMEGVECVVPQLWRGCRGAERDTQSCPNVQHSHAPEFIRLWPRAPHTPKTQMLDVSSVFRKKHTRRHTHTHKHVHTLEHLWACSCYCWVLSHIRGILIRPAAA